MGGGTCIQLSPMMWISPSQPRSVAADRAKASVSYIPYTTPQADSAASAAELPALVLGPVMLQPPALCAAAALLVSLDGGMFDAASMLADEPARAYPRHKCKLFEHPRSVCAHTLSTRTR